MKIGIMGGTFNPIHKGHVALALAAIRQFRFDKIWFMPSGLPAHKANTELISAEHRIRMVQLAIQDIPEFEVSSFETDRKGFTYTADTLVALKELYPEDEFFFIIGGDSLMKFHHWVKPEVISKHATLLAAGRSGYSKEELQRQANFLREQFGTVISFLDLPEIPISSNEIRTCCKQKKLSEVTQYLPQSVLQYIEEQKLYIG